MPPGMQRPEEDEDEDFFDLDSWVEACSTLIPPGTQRPEDEDDDEEEPAMALGRDDMAAIPIQTRESFMMMILFMVGK